MYNLRASKDEATGRWSMSGVESDEITFANICRMISDGKSFKFARYGDGEIYCMDGKRGCNCDRHIYYPELGKALRESIVTEPDYMVGIQPLSVSHLPASIDNYFGHFKSIYNADVLHNASIDGKLHELWGALKGKYVILVGPAHLSSIYDAVHIVIPSANCWLEYEKIKQQIEFHVEGINNAVVLLCASMISEVLIHYFADYPHTFIDCGSVFDPYVGIYSRKYHSKLKI